MNLNICCNCYYLNDSLNQITQPIQKLGSFEGTAFIFSCNIISAKAKYVIFVVYDIAVLGIKVTLRASSAVYIDCVEEHRSLSVFCMDRDDDQSQPHFLGHF